MRADSCLVSDPTDKSTFELGMDALNRMPRAQAIEGALAYQGLSYVCSIVPASVNHSTHSPSPLSDNVSRTFSDRSPSRERQSRVNSYKSFLRGKRLTWLNECERTECE